MPEIYWRGNLWNGSMTPREMNGTKPGWYDIDLKVHSRSPVEWAWEMHKNCDQLMHQRLAAFTTAQAMTLAAFTVLSIGLFNHNSGGGYIIISACRFIIVFFGLVLSAFTWMVTRPMLYRLDWLNEQILKEEIPVYKDYMTIALNDFEIPGLLRLAFRIFPSGRRQPREIYRDVIPRYLPNLEAILWGLLLAATVVQFGFQIYSHPPCWPLGNCHSN